MRLFYHRHKQLEQLVREMKNYTPYRPRMTILGSREQLCIHKKVSRSSNKADDCMKLVDEKRCPLYFKTKRINAHENIRHDKANVWDIEDIVRVGKMVQGCPYYATRSEFEHAELIFCPYNYILDPTIREIMGINVTGAVVILDEAHNVEDVARESGSFEVTDVELKRIAFHLAELIKYKVLPEKHAHLRHVVTSIEDWMIQEEDTAFHIQEFERRVKVWSGPQIVENMDNLQISKQNLADILLPAFNEALELRQAADEEDELLEEEAQEAGQRKIMKGLPMSDLRVLQGLFMVLKYLFQEDQDHQDDYSMVLIKQIAPQSTLGNWKLKLGFWCHNPGIVFRELSALTRSVVLTSGTLSPLDTFATELDTKFAMTIETNHVIDKSQVWINTLPIGPSGAIMKGVYATMETFQYQDDVGETLLQISSIVPYGVLCFMPSYSAMDKLLNRWKTTGIYENLEQKKQIFIEPRGDNKHQFRKLITSYYKCISDLEAGISTSNGGINGSLFFAVYRGKVSEGIDFKDNQCRAVVSIGVPYPSFKETKVSLKREYNDQKKRKYGSTRRAISGNEWYDSQAFRAINQALGRCIRHRKDWGAIILLEERFAHERHINGLSKWIRRLRDSNNLPFHAKMEDLQEFVHRQSPADKEIKIEPDI
ncbi:helicase C-terminal domain-containing protein [Gongronella butleri]|nr:helicase C-terminal domain-containing protein [Gongronella butleri]